MTKQFVEDCLLKLGCKMSIKGFPAIVAATLVCDKENAGVGNLSKAVYIDAGKLVGTTASRFERRTRHAIERLYEDGSPEDVDVLFVPDEKSGKLTNKEFLSRFLCFCRERWEEEEDGGMKYGKEPI